MRLVLILTLACVSFTFAQQKPEFLGDKGLAEEYFRYGNFEFALEELLILHARKPNKIEYQYQLGKLHALEQFLLDYQDLHNEVMKDE